MGKKINTDRLIFSFLKKLERAAGLPLELHINTLSPQEAEFEVREGGETYNYLLERKVRLVLCPGIGPPHKAIFEKFSEWMPSSEFTANQNDLLEKWNLELKKAGYEGYYEFEPFFVTYHRLAREEDKSDVRGFVYLRANYEEPLFAKERRKIYPHKGDFVDMFRLSVASIEYSLLE